MIYAPFLLQALAMFVDEFYFHHKRRLPAWEILGHPLDTLFSVLPYAWVLAVPYDPASSWIFGALATFSCLFVTKDEFVHRQKCDSWENWLHAVLFLLHPVTFIAAGYLWANGADLNFLKLQIALMVSFLVYQLVYWGRTWHR